MTRVEKLWGHEEIICNEPEYCLKFLHVDAGWQCSLHMHPAKKETFHVVRGVVYLQLGGLGSEPRIMSVGDTVTILPGEYHRFGSAAGAVMAEVSTRHSDEDVVRIEESRRID